MELKALFFLLGSLLILIALIGGGFSAKDIEIPKVGMVPRILSGLLGGIFIVSSINLNQGTSLNSKQAGLEIQPERVTNPTLPANPTPSIITPTDVKNAHQWFETANQYFEAEQWEEAIKAYDNVIASKDDTRDVCLPCSWAKRGYSQEMLKQYENAMFSYVQALRIEPNLTMAQNGLSRLQNP